MGVDEIFDDEYLNEPATKVTIFLSVFNVHTNRAPLDGEIKYQRYTCGQFVPAYEKNASFENERHAIGMDNGRMRFLVIQIAGLLARRIVSWVTVGTKLQQGETYGMIKSGQYVTDISILGITKEQADLDNIPQQEGCTQKVQRVDASTMKVAFSCKGGQDQPPSSGEGTITMQGPTAYTGQFRFKTQNQGKPEQIDMAQSGKWLSANCGAIKPMPMGR